MSHYALSPTDEFPHAPTAESNFNESVYVNAFDPARRMSGWMRLGNRVNEGHAELSVCLYLPDGRIACQFQRPAIAHNEAFEAGGLSVEVREPLRELEMRYTGELLVIGDPGLLRSPKRLFAEARRAPASVRWQHVGTSPVHGGVPKDPAQPTLYGRDFSLGHFNQHTRVTGEIRIGDETWPVDGYGWRDHSWGPRYWQNILFDRLYMANFGAERGIMLLKIANRDGAVRRGGVLQIGDRYEEIADLDVHNEWNDAKDPVSFILTARTARRSAVIRGRILNCAPLRNRREEGGAVLESRIAECFTELEWDGRQGFGMTEYVERLVDGVPAGYPL
ncbi:MAG TPA: hypothetical protein PJ986_06270 [Gammaproteobacteria bacterium]|nr:hypothetical protein [Gammaproteobacteria bacterium]